MRAGYKKLKKTFHFLIIILCAALSALNYKVFVFPNVFAPAGVDGICTMIQYLTNTSMGYLSLIANVPLIIVALFILKRDFIAKSEVYTVSFSVAVVLLCEYTHALRLTSELVDLRVGYVNPYSA